MVITRAFYILMTLLALMPSVAAAADGGFCPALRVKENYKNWQSYRYLVEGRDGWVFRTSTDFKSDFSLNSAALGRIKRLNEALASKNIRLLMVPLPTRGMMHGDKIVRKDFDRVKAIESYTKMADDLRNQGVLVAIPDKFDGQDAYYYPKDHHWRAEGAQDMAGQVAQQVREGGVALTPSHFITEQQGSVDHTGTFAKLMEDVCKAPADVQTVPDFVTYMNGQEDNLLGDTPDPEVILVGTSNSTSAASHANFDGFLKQALGTDVLNLSVSGGGADSALLHLLASDRIKNNPPKLIIWEFPAYQDFDSGPFLRQAIAAAYGDCGQDAIVRKDSPLSGSFMDLFPGLSDHAINGERYYLSFQFSNFDKHKFRAVMTLADGKSSYFDFVRDKYYMPDGRFFVELEQEAAPIDTLKIQLPENLGGRVNAAVCRR
jgi:alginate biosynthesis protein AlgX